MTNYFIKKYSDKIGIIKDEIKDIRYYLKNNRDIPDIIKILPYIINYKIIIFDCNNNELNIEEYGDNEDRKINILKYMEKYEILIKL